MYYEYICVFMLHKILDMKLALARKSQPQSLLQKCLKSHSHQKMTLNTIHHSRCTGNYMKNVYKKNEKTMNACPLLNNVRALIQ